MPECEGFHIVPRQYCYPLNNPSWERYFQEADAAETMKWVVHFGNFLSHEKTVNINTTAPYIQMAQKYCPKVFEGRKDFF